jgi:hypothetical protein
MNMDKMDVEIDSELLSELLLARLRDRQRRTQDDLEAFRVEFDLFKTLEGQHGHAEPSSEAGQRRLAKIGRRIVGNLTAPANDNVEDCPNIIQKRVRHPSSI